MGSPSVFQTAPPQPASNARSIIDPIFVGGADASQKGLGDFIPAKLLVKSAIRIQCGKTRVRTGSGSDWVALLLASTFSCRETRSLPPPLCAPGQIRSIEHPAYRIRNLLL